MGISGISNCGHSQAISLREFSEQRTDKKLQIRGDYVAISDKGWKELAKSKMDTKVSPQGMEDMGDEQEESTATAASSFVLDNEALEAKIKTLMTQLMNIMQSARPLEEKMQQAQPIQQEINKLPMRISELRIQSLMLKQV